jgi:hypothetical protein
VRWLLATVVFVGSGFVAFVALGLAWVAVVINVGGTPLNEFSEENGGVLFAITIALSVVAGLFFTRTFVRRGS